MDSTVGAAVGWVDSARDGATLGLSVGCPLGTRLGRASGKKLGWAVGGDVGGLVSPALVGVLVVGVRVGSPVVVRTDGNKVGRRVGVGARCSQETPDACFSCTKYVTVLVVAYILIGSHNSTLWLVNAV